MMGGNFYASSNPGELPKTSEELELYTQLNYKQSVEIAEEEIISNVFSASKFEEKKRRIAYDLAVLGIGASKTTGSGEVIIGLRLTLTLGLEEAEIFYQNFPNDSSSSTEYFEGPFLTALSLLSFSGPSLHCSRKCFALIWHL